MGDPVEAILDSKGSRQDTVNNPQSEKPSCTFIISPSSFMHLVTKSNVFVDKSLLIENILTCSFVDILITRPRRWGKTLNLDMIKTFVEARVDENGLISNIRNQALFEGGDYINDEGTTIFMKPLNIAQRKNEKFYQDSSGKFPVLFLNLNGEATDGWNSDLFRHSIRNAYRKHDNLYKFLLIKMIKSHNRITNKLEQIALENDDYISILESFIAAKFNPVPANIAIFKKYRDGDKDIDLSNSVQFLLEVLNDYFKKEVYVLIDEYDTLLNKYIGTQYYDSIFSRLRSLLFCLKNNSLVKKAVMMGITPISLGNIYSGLNFFHAYTVITGHFSKYFGLTEIEVRSLISTVVGINEEKKNQIEKEVKLWYNGYNIGGVTVYNPWSIMSCLQEHYTYPEMDPYQLYWVNSGNFMLFEKEIERVKFFPKIHHLFTTGEIHHKITPRDRTNEEDTSFSKNTDFNKLDDFCCLLLHTGYLTLKSEDIYSIPNKEIYKCFYIDLLPIWMKSKYENASAMSELINSLSINIENKGRYFHYIQNDFLNQLTENDKANKCENDFQEMMAAPARIFQLASDDAIHLLKSEVPTQEGKRTDHAFFPIKTKSETGIVHEYKQTNTSSKKDELLIDGLWQIFSKLYLEPIITSIDADEQLGHIKFIIVRVIVFYLSSSGSRWVVDYIECKMSISRAKQIHMIFLNHPEKERLANAEIMEEERRASRKVFLKTYKCKYFYQLLQKYFAISTDELEKVEKIESNAEEREIGKEKMRKYSKTEKERKVTVRTNVKGNKKPRKKINK